MVLWRWKTGGFGYGAEVIGIFAICPNRKLSATSRHHTTKGLYQYLSSMKKSLSSSRAKPYAIQRPIRVLPKPAPAVSST